MAQISGPGHEIYIYEPRLCGRLGHHVAAMENYLPIFGSRMNFYLKLIMGLVKSKAGLG